ncbi:hypothetical protein [Halosimplex sp. J119]
MSSISLAVISGIVLITGPAPSYEASLYNAYPVALWILIALMPAYPLYSYAFTKISKTRLVVLVVNCLLSYSILLLLPLFRGYWLYGRDRADVLAHLAYTNTIVESGFIHETNFYPIVHILISTFHYLSDLSVRSVTVVLSLVFLIVYLSSVYLYIKRSYGSGQLFRFLPALTLIFLSFHTTTHPALLSFMFVPLVLYVYKNSTITEWGKRYTLILSVLSVYIVFFHPMTALILFVSLVVVILSRYVFSNTGRQALTPILFLLVSFLTWHMIYSSTSGKISGIISSYLYGSTTSIAESQSETVVEAVNYVQVSIGFVNRYGPIFLFAVVSVLWIGTYFVDYLVNRDPNVPTSSRVEVSLHFVIGLFFAVAFLLFDLIVGNPIRAARYLIFASVIIVGNSLWTLYRNYERSLLFRICFAFLLAGIVVSSTLAVVNTFNSQYHFTEAEEQGDTWVIEHLDTGNATITNQDSSSKMYMYLTSSIEGADVFSDYSREELAYIRSGGARGTLSSGAGEYYVLKEYDYKKHRWSRPHLTARAKLYSPYQADKYRHGKGVQIVYDSGRFTVSNAVD